MQRTCRESSSTTTYSDAPLAVVLVAISSASPTSKGCTTKSMMTELKRFMIVLLKAKDRATMMEDSVSHTFVTLT